MVVSCRVVGCPNRAKKVFPKVIVNQGDKLRHNYSEEVIISGIMNVRFVELNLIAIHNGSQGMGNSCPRLIEKVGIHQNMTGCALITF